MTKSDVAKLRDARANLERVQADHPGDPISFEAANAEVAKAEKKVPFGSVRGWRY